MTIILAAALVLTLVIVAGLVIVAVNLFRYMVEGFDIGKRVTEGREP